MSRQIYDSPAALNHNLREALSSSPSTWQHQLGLLYSVYSMPNIVMPFIAGWLVESLGAHFVLLGLSSLVMLGSVLFALGVQTNAFIWMLMGRAMMGMAGRNGIGASRS